MCRLLGWATRAPVTLHGLLGEEDLLDFTELSVKHGDGWGVARATDGRRQGAQAPRHRPRQPLVRALGPHPRHRPRPGPPALGDHGAQVGIENTHPFTDGHVAFAHNGSVLSPASLDRLAAPTVARLRRGTTDSERYFLALLTRMADGVPPHEALRDTADEIARTSPFTSLNCLLMTPDELIALCRYDPAGPLEDTAPSTTGCATGPRTTPSWSPRAAGAAAGRNWRTAICWSSAAARWRAPSCRASG